MAEERAHFPNSGSQDVGAWALSRDRGAMMVANTRKSSMSWKIFIIVGNVYKEFSFIVCLTIVTLILAINIKADNREKNDKTKPFIQEKVVSKNLHAYRV